MLVRLGLGSMENKSVYDKYFLQRGSRIWGVTRSIYITFA